MEMSPFCSKEICYFYKPFISRRFLGAPFNSNSIGFFCWVGQRLILEGQRGKQPVSVGAAVAFLVESLTSLYLWSIWRCRLSLWRQIGPSL